ncbi:hypothetical protein [Pantoea sp. BAV 3049]|uniref:hypothetical protein n=1 Tax=Pantoea sp. BAV 3049 TaxID=2654188 RepID=UPI0018EF2D03|nr:hypothetical protein [Pantoea sp. BAV 3049]
MRGSRIWAVRSIGGIVGLDDALPITVVPGVQMPDLVAPIIEAFGVIIIQNILLKSGDDTTGRTVN